MFQRCSDGFFVAVNSSSIQASSQGTDAECPFTPQRARWLVASTTTQHSALTLLAPLMVCFGAARKLRGPIFTKLLSSALVLVTATTTTTTTSTTSSTTSTTTTCTTTTTSTTSTTTTTYKLKTNICIDISCYHMVQNLAKTCTKGCYFFACQRFHPFLFGLNFRIYCYHLFYVYILISQFNLARNVICVSVFIFVVMVILTPDHIWMLDTWFSTLTRQLTVPLFSSLSWSAVSDCTSTNSSIYHSLLSALSLQLTLQSTLKLNINCIQSLFWNFYFFQNFNFNANYGDCIGAVIFTLTSFSISTITTEIFQLHIFRFCSLCLVTVYWLRFLIFLRYFFDQIK